ncbi:hypothetical protein CEXT_149031 [Caerostris extrusa]|uniref:Uncharacterized protein n=1 Tax=Caerostris extrusa TaxID=172846 RepID=A0AAV4Y4C5_CAEEX|nr:hypothetical protein CEXT_149031 [Caerostris extrusa]
MRARAHGYGTKLCFDAIAGHYNPFSLQPVFNQGACPGETDRSSWCPNFSVTPFPGAHAIHGGGGVHVYRGPIRKVGVIQSVKPLLLPQLVMKGGPTGQVRMEE